MMRTAGHVRWKRGACLTAARKAFCKERLQGALHALSPADLCAARAQLPPLRIVGYTPCCREALLVVHLLTQYTIAVIAHSHVECHSDDADTDLHHSLAIMYW